MKRIFSALLALAAVLGMGFATVSITSVDFDRQVLTPGESGTITVKLTNVDLARVVESVVVDTSGPSGFTFGGSVPVGDMNPGTSTTVSIPVTANADVKSGTYRFDIKVTGIARGADVSNPDFRSTIIIPVLRKPLITFSNFSETYVENSQFNFTINNYGGGVSDVRISVLPPFAIFGADQVFLPTLAGNGSQDVQIDLNTLNVSEGQSTLNVAMTYNDELGNEQNDSGAMVIVVKKERTDLVFTQLDPIAPKKDNAARFRVTNNGKAIGDVRLTFTNPNVTLRSGEIVIGDLASGESKEVTFQIYPDLIPGIQNLDAQITYMDAGKEKVKSIPVTVDINPDSSVSVFVEAKTVPVTKGAENTLSITVANTWDYQIESTTVGVEGDFFTLENAQNQQYIGTLNKDDFSSVQFKVRINGNAPDTGNLTVNVKYKDVSGQWVTRKETIPVSLTSPQAQGDNTVWLLGGAAFVIVAAYALFFRKKAVKAA